MGNCAGKEKSEEEIRFKKEKKERKKRKKSKKEYSYDMAEREKHYNVKSTNPAYDPVSNEERSKEFSNIYPHTEGDSNHDTKYKNDKSKGTTVNTLSEFSESAPNTTIYNEATGNISEINDPNSDSISLLSDSPGLDRKIGKPSPKKMSIFNSPKPLSGPRVLFKSPLPKHLAFRREKNNSTSSLYIKDTINSPNVDEILRCMSVALLYHVKNGMALTTADKLDQIFSERVHPLTRDVLDLTVLPDVSTIYRFINLIFRVQKLPPECAILCLAYIERVLSGGRIVLHPENWRRIVFGSIIIATKVWEDESVWNVDFLDLFPLLTLVNLNNLENKFLELLQFNVLIIGSEYAKYYFELRALSQFDSFPLEPLNREKQAQLELRSQKTNEKVSQFTTTTNLLKDATPRRSRSVDFFDPKSPPAIIA